MTHPTTITTQWAVVTLTLDDGPMRLDVSSAVADGPVIHMAVDHAKNATPAAFVREWARHMRGMLSRRKRWSRNHATAGLWTLSASAFSSAVAWQVDFTDRPHKAVTVVAGDIPAPPMPNFHGQRIRQPQIDEARDAAAVAALEWVAGIEAQLLALVEGQE